MKVTTRVSSLLFTLFVATEADAQLRVNASNQHQSLDCNGQTVHVLGSRNQLTLAGRCGRVEIDGSDNVVSIDAVDDIEVVGQRNRVTWRTTLGALRAPRASMVGPGNSITQQIAAHTDGVAATAKPVTSSAALVLSKAWVVDGSTLRMPGNGQRETVDCDGRDIVILGNRNTVTLRGHCASISVPGTANVVNAESVSRIRSEGNDNEFTWRRLRDGREPEVTLLGTKNRVNKIP